MNLKTVLKEYEENIKNQYPKYDEITNEIFEKIQNMLFEDYDSFASDNKKLNYMKSYLADIIETAFVDKGHKSYLKSIVEIFYCDEINKYICKVLNTKSKNFLETLKCLKYRVIYWQGYEGMENEKLVQLLACIKG